MIREYFTMRNATTKKNVTYTSIGRRTAIFAGLLFLAVPALAANHTPTFTGGASQNLSACFNGSAVSINSLLAIVDSDAGQTETWTINSGPVNGALSGLPSTAVSTGGVLMPAGLTYTPATGFTGADSFSIQVSDGTATANTTVYVTVFPLPTLSSTLSPAAVCNQAVFSYTPSSSTTGAAFTWNRPFTGGISNPGASGTGSISETLSNVTYYDVPVSYNYTISAHGCSSVQGVTVTVHPAIRLTSSLNDTTCTGGTFTYVPTSATPGTSFTWTRAGAAGISPATASGSGNINEALTNSTGGAVNVVYVYMLSANGCTATRNVTVTVLPQAPLTSITTASPATVCAGTLFQNFGAGIAPPAGASYVWSAMNATITAVGNNGQFCLVSFPSAGSASVSLSVNMAGAHCVSNGTYAVNVTTASAAPAANILYYNFQLIYLDNTQDSYQWGYDNVSTLDSTLIAGAVFQSYPFPGTTPDFVHNYYWVMTTKNGCTQKTYFNGPTAAPNVNAGVSEPIRVYPNPAGSFLHLEVNTLNGNDAAAELVNTLGQRVKTVSCTGRQTQVDISELPGGCYFVRCTQNGVTIGTSRFIKN